MTEREFTNAGFRQYLGEHRLMGAQCKGCGALYLPPRSLCPRCFGQELNWHELSGKAKLQAFTIVHIAPSAMIAAGYGRDNPYCSGIVKLNEGPSVSAQILGVDATQPETIAIGTPLKKVFIDRGEDEERETILAFEIDNG